MGVEGAGRAPPWRQLRTDRKGQVSRVEKRRQVLDVAKTSMCEGATQSRWAPGTGASTAYEWRNDPQRGGDLKQQKLGSGKSVQ